MMPPIPKWVLIHNATLIKTKQQPFQDAIETSFPIKKVRFDIPTKGVTINTDGKNTTYTGIMFYDRITSRIEGKAVIEAGDTILFGNKKFKVESVPEVAGLNGEYHHLEVVLK